MRSGWPVQQARDEAMHAVDDFEQAWSKRAQVKGYAVHFTPEQLRQLGESAMGCVSAFAKLAELIAIAKTEESIDVIADASELLLRLQPKSEEYAP